MKGKQIIGIGMFAGALTLAYKGQAQDTVAQVNALPGTEVELLAAPPNLSMQGVFPNPAVFTQLGDFVWATSTLEKDRQGAQFLINKSLLERFQLTLDYSTSRQAGVRVGFEPVERLHIGYGTSMANPKGELGAIVRAIHTKGHLTQLAGVHNLGDGTYGLALEVRQKLSKRVGIAGSGKITMKNCELQTKGAGIMLMVDKSRFSLGLGGKDWDALRAAAQVPFEMWGKTVFMDGRVAVPLDKAMKPVLERINLQLGLTIPLGAKAKPMMRWKQVRELIGAEKSFRKGPCRDAAHGLRAQKPGMMRLG